MKKIPLLASYSKQKDKFTSVPRHFKARMLIRIALVAMYASLQVFTGSVMKGFAFLHFSMSHLLSSWNSGNRLIFAQVGRKQHVFYHNPLQTCSSHKKCFEMFSTWVCRLRASSVFNYWSSSANSWSTLAALLSETSGTPFASSLGGSRVQFRLPLNTFSE